MAHKHDSNENIANGFWHSRYAVGLIILAAIAGYFLVTEHWAHVLGILPYVLLLACPLMHLFMHHGHGGHHRDPNAQGEDKPDNRNRGN